MTDYTNMTPEEEAVAKFAKLKARIEVLERQREVLIDCLHGCISKPPSVGAITRPVANTSSEEFLKWNVARRAQMKKARIYLDEIAKETPNG